jgi:hypothetical protein
MMLRRLLPFLALVNTSALAQEPDTTSAWRYYPLAVGNVREYRHTYMSDLTGYERHTITGDTLIEGRYYFLRLGESYDASGVFINARTQEVRFDTLTASVKAWWVTDERALTCPLDADFESKVDCPDICGPYVYVHGGYGQTVTVGQSNVTTSVKRYDTGGCEAGYTYAAGIGEESYGFWYSSKTLTYARIDGVEYGEPFPVGTEPLPEAAPALRLVVHPNPMHGAGTVTLTLARPQHATLAVYDVLGRRVTLLHAGALSAGHHAFQFDGTGLPAGTYFLRATVDDGAVTSPVVLR